MNLNWATHKWAARSKIWLLPIRPLKITLNLGYETKKFLFSWRHVSTFQTAITDCIYKRTGFFPRRHSSNAKITLVSLRNQRAHSATDVTTIPRSATSDIDERALQTQIAKVSMLNDHYCTEKQNTFLLPSMIKVWEHQINSKTFWKKLSQLNFWNMYFLNKNIA